MRPGPRPHTWKVQGEVPHEQYLCWLQMRAQANYRQQPFLLTFEEYQQLWQGLWDLKGRGREDYSLVRIDSTGAWEISNVECRPRIDYLRRGNKPRRPYRTKKWRQQHMNQN